MSITSRTTNSAKSGYQTGSHHEGAEDQRHAAAVLRQGRTEHARRDGPRGRLLKELGPEAENAGVILGLENTISAANNLRIMERPNPRLSGSITMSEIPPAAGSILFAKSGIWEKRTSARFTSRTIPTISARARSIFQLCCTPSTTSTTRAGWSWRPMLLPSLWKPTCVVTCAYLRRLITDGKV